MASGSAGPGTFEKTSEWRESVSRATILAAQIGSAAALAAVSILATNGSSEPLMRENTACVCSSRSSALGAARGTAAWPSRGQSTAGAHAVRVHRPSGHGPGRMPTNW